MQTIVIQTQTHIVPILKKGIDFCTRPSKQITDADTRSRVRLLSSLLMITIPLIIFFIVRPNERPLVSDKLNDRILMISGVMMASLYFLSRTRHYLQTALGTIFVLVVTILAVFNQSTSGITYAYLAVIILLSSSLLDTRWLLLVIVSILIATIALVSDHPDIGTDTDPFAFVVVASAAVLATSFYRNRQEIQRTEALVDRENRLHLILEQMPAILWTTDENLVVTSSTGSGFNNISVEADELVGTWIATAPPIEKLSMFRTESHYQALEGKSSTYQSQWGDVSFQCFIEPLYDAKKRVIGCVGVALDVTARRDAEQVAIDLRVEKERVQVLSDFIQNASHDLSTPLSVMNANIYLLQNSIEVEKQHRHIKILSEQTGRLSDLVQSMLTMVRLDQMDDFSKIPIDLNSLVESLPNKYETDIRIKRLQLVTQFDPDLPPLEANESYLAQALEEILDNAVQFTNVGGTIFVSTRKEGERAIIEIRDTGIGIAPEDQIRIFERFYRVDKSRSTTTGGTGLGLAIAKRIIDGHSGRIHVQSEPGEGTTIRIFLPLQPKLQVAMYN